MVKPVGSVSHMQHAEPSFTTTDLKSHVIQSKPRIELLLIQENTDLKKIGDDFMMTIVKHLKRENLAVKLGLQEQLTALEAQAKATSSQNSWFSLSSIASSVLSFCGIAAGVQLGNGYLIASGVTGFANLLITRFEGWDWIATTLASDNEEAKVKIRTLMPLTMTLMSFALGINGTQTAGEEVLKSFQRLQSYIQGGVEIGKARNTYEKGKIDLQVMESDQNLSLHNKKVEALSRELKSWFDLFRQISSYSKQSVKQAIRETSAAATGV